MIATDDKTIITMLNARDEDALRGISRLYGALCIKIAGDILGSTEDAEECMNDALLTVWNTVPPAKPDNLRAYLVKLVRNKAIDRYHAERREKRGGGQTAAVLDELSEVLSSGQTVESEMERRAISGAVTAFLRGLPEKQRSLFVLRYWGMTPVADLAAAFGMSESNAKVMLLRLRKKLRAFLEKEGIL